MQKSHINIDEIGSYLPIIEQILERANILTQIKSECLSSEDSFRKLWHYLDSGEGHSKSAHNAVDILHEEIPKYVRSVSAFHGCRVIDRDSYRRRGIEICDFQAQVDQAIELFGEEEEIRRIVLNLENGYWTHNHGKVYAIKSIKHHNRIGNFDHALGSEILRIISKRITPNQENLYFSLGEPSVIEFAVPIPWMIEHRSYISYLKDLLACVCDGWVPYNRPNDVRMGGIILEKSVPPESLIRRFLCDDEGYTIKIIEEYSYIT